MLNTINTQIQALNEAARSPDADIVLIMDELQMFQGLRTRLLTLNS